MATTFQDAAGVGPAKSAVPTDVEEYWSEARLREAGAELAVADADPASAGLSRDPARRQRDNKRVVTAVYRAHLAATAAGALISPAAEWLLDNFYLVEENIRQVRRDLPARFYRQLPVMGDAADGAGNRPAGTPRVTALARACIAHSHCEVSAARLDALVEGYQERRPLRIGELWALPSILRFVLIEELRTLAEQIERRRRMRDAANRLADRLLAPDATRGSTGASAAPRAGDATAADDDAFASQLLYRLRDASVEAHATTAWLEHRLEARGSDAEEVIIAEQHRLSAGTVRIGNIVRSLRAIDDVDWTKWFARHSRVDALLRGATDFDALDFASRDRYRDAIERLARRSDATELEVAEAAIRLLGDAQAARAAGPGADEACAAEPDVGRWLVGDALPELEATIGCELPPSERARRAWRGLGWLSIALPVSLLTLALVALAFASLVAVGVSPLPAALLALLAGLPASEAATGLFNTLAAALARPARLVGFEYVDGVPASARTLVVVPCMLTSRDDIDDLVRNLEVHHLSNTRGELVYALASDWPDAAHETSPADEELLEFARARVTDLAARYAHDGRTRFFLAHRRRLRNDSEGVWMGWERKRGKLLELNRLLRGDPDTSFLPMEPALPDGVVHVMTLDSDTRITRDAVTRLVGKMAHPLNRPVLDADGARVRAGYGIMQPRVVASLTSGEEASTFQRVFSQDRGLDPYVFAVSDVYQDLTGEGSFTGKGLYHVDAAIATLDGRFDENAVLSHDLLEGALARCALASDVELVEDFPVRYSVEASRQHRWVRGDWQLLPFVLGTARGEAGIGALGRWKMLDNLRRSLVAPAWVAASVIGWCALPPAVALAWQAALVVSLFVAPTLLLLRRVVPRSREHVVRAHFRSLGSEALAATAQVALRIAFVAHAAAENVDAIARTLWRTYVSRRHLLEWRTAAAQHASDERGLGASYRRMAGAVAIGLLAALAAAVAGPGALALALPFCAAWVASPGIARAVSRTAETEDRLDVPDADRAELRRIARRAWEYFETFVTEEHHYLPPDNFQETPHPVVAGRTSPTNIGLYLLSIVSARDFGWIGMERTVTNLERTLGTLEAMERHRGHLYNWYDTRTLAPLLPTYVSAVDSGNLAGHLIALSTTCRDWSEALYAVLPAGVDGIGDVAGVIAEELAEVPDDRRASRPLRRRLEERLRGLQSAVRAISEAPEFAAVGIADLETMASDVGRLAGELDHEISSRRTRSVVEWSVELERACAANRADAAFDKGEVEALRARLAELRDRSRAFAFGMDFGFLMREDRRLLSIGYRVAEGELDPACYDLLASEARLASLFGIAKGDLPTEHWFRLGRPIVAVGARGALMSWSGSMFEYLMPPLVMREQQGGILNRTNALAVRRQIEYGRKRGVPWGVSEAAFSARDREMTYQYSCFGVPSLGMKRDLAADLVIAPYASLLASQYRPREALENLRALRKLGALGPHGFHDAVDFTASRLPDGASHVVVRNYMAHHHGMSILALSNVCFGGRLRERFHADPVIEAAELLLQEKAPREIPTLVAKAAASELVRGRAEEDEPVHRRIDDPRRAPPAVALLSNGHYSLALGADGGGQATWNGLAVTRWQLDPAEERWGTFVFLRDAGDGAWWSATAAPRSAPNERAHAVFSDSRAEFHKTVGTLRSRVDVIVAGGIDAEGRRLTLANTGDVERIVEITSYAEPVLSTRAADAAHPAFSKMFVETRIDADGTIRAVRNKRRHDEPDMRVAHVVTGESHAARGTQAETDRRRFVGRGRSLATAAAFDPGSTLSGTDGFTLDPVLALRRTLRVAPGKEASLVFWTIAAPNETDLDAGIAHCRHPESFEREAMHAWTRSQVQLRYIGTSALEATVFQRLARYLVVPGDGLGRSRDDVRAGSQSLLWSTGISGDFPLFVLRIDAEADMAIVRKALRAQEYVRARGLLADLVIVNERDASYAQELQNGIDALCENARLRGVAGGPREHIFALRRELLAPEVYECLLATARIVLHARNGTFSTQLDRAERTVERTVERGVDGADATRSGELAVPARRDARATIAPDARRPERETSPPAAPSRAAVARDAAPATRFGPAAPPPSGEGLDFWNGYGGFSADGREYVVRLAPGDATPQPWINVLSGTDFGAHVSAEGAGFTWSRNSRDYQLTPWTNDPVIDRPGETFLVVDRDTGRVHSPLPALGEGPDRTLETRHGFGYSSFECRCDDLVMTLVQTVHPDEPVKLSRLRLTNAGARPRRLRAHGYAEWVLGNDRTRTAPFVETDAADGGAVLLATNPYTIDYAGRTAFLAVDGKVASATSDRGAFIGDGTVRRPGLVVDGRSEAGGDETVGDPCAALARDVRLAPGESADVTFLLGDCASAEDAIELVRRVREADVDEVLARVREGWNELAGVLQVDTPDPSMNVMINGWLPYQSIACRVRSRSAFYQASGAFGFRDQLQDTLAYLIHDPALARAQILNAAGRQFPEGDVQHWWLPASGTGVRTMISDDVVWLGHAVAHYVDVTGDDALLDVELPFLEGPELDPGEHDRMYTPGSSERTVPVYEHCALALDLAIRRTGEHGLPLMLGGDWNDGMNRVGEAGRGESVWLGWFLAQTLQAFLPLAEARADGERATRWSVHRDALLASLAEHGWDGGWYRRAWYDDGAPLGSTESDECRIDSLAQSWSVMSGLGDPNRSRTAMDAVLTRLVDDEADLVRLFEPSFERTDHEPGYIKGYPPGVRENGGQYTHAATWVVYALALQGRGDEAHACFSKLNPVRHATDRAAADVYRVEPYSVAADVYSSPDKLGRGGWTWYTGSAGWLYRAGVEAILGITKRGDRVHVRPALPSGWPGYSAELRVDGEVLAIRVSANGDGAPDVSVNGVDVGPEGYPLGGSAPSSSFAMPA